MTITSSVYRGKYYVPELPPQYVGDFSSTSSSIEARLSRCLLDESPQARTVQVVKGMGGTGKSTALAAVGRNPDIRSKFTAAIWFISLGEHARPANLVAILEEIVRGVLGDASADEVFRLSKLDNGGLHGALAQAISMLQERPVLLLLDDVWAGLASPVFGQATVFSLIRSCVRSLTRRSALLRVVISTRDDKVARLVPESYQIPALPLVFEGSAAKSVLFRYAGFDRTEGEVVARQESVRLILQWCRGLPLALSIVGSSVPNLIARHGFSKLEVWEYCRNSIATSSARVLQTGNDDHPGVFAMIHSSLKAAAKRISCHGFDIEDSFKHIGVFQTQEAIPVEVLGCLWGIDGHDLWETCGSLAELQLIFFSGGSQTRSVRFHGFVHAYCVHASGADGVQYQHVLLLENLWKKSGLKLPDRTQGHSTRPWWDVVGGSIDGNISRFVGENLLRHLAEGGFANEAIEVLSDYRWTTARLHQTGVRNDLGVVADDIQVIVFRSGKAKGSASVGLELISDAIRLARPFIASNPRELAFQMYGRLRPYAGQNRVVTKYLQTLERYAKLPWLMPADGVLKQAGGPVILRVKLPCALTCVCVLSSRDEVVVAGRNGYLAIFSLDCASVVHDLDGHIGVVWSVLECAHSGRIFSVGEDGSVRSWSSESGKGLASPLLQDGIPKQALTVSQDGSILVCGDDAGTLIALNTDSGEVINKWPAHQASVIGLRLYDDDTKIISGAADGTIRKWSVRGVGIGSEIRVGVKLTSVAFSRGGKKVAYGGSFRSGIIDLSTSSHAAQSSSRWWGRSIIFSPNGSAAFIGQNNGAICVLSSDGRITSQWEPHSGSIFGLAFCQDRRLLVSVGFDGTLCLQRHELDGGNISSSELQQGSWASATETRESLILEDLVVLPGRKRLVYATEGKGLWMIDLTKAYARNTPQSDLNFKKRFHPVPETSGLHITCIASSHSGLFVVVGVLGGHFLIFDCNDWSRRCYGTTDHGPARCVTVSANDTLVAIGTVRDVSLFTVANGDEIHIPLGDGVGYVANIAFTSDSQTFVACYLSGKSASLRAWQFREGSTVIAFFDIALNHVSPVYPIALSVTNTCAALRQLANRETCIYDYATGSEVMVEDGDPDVPEVLTESIQEHSALVATGALSMKPFGQQLVYHGDGDVAPDVLGTLETGISSSFLPDHWVFDVETGLLLGGCPRKKLTCAMLITSAAPSLCFSRAVDTAGPSAIAEQDNDSGRQPTVPSYTVFISHAGPDKEDVAIPLSKVLSAKGISCFIDKESLRPGQQAPIEMDRAMKEADVGVFILSPEFAGRTWPMRELLCFLKRTKEGIGSSEIDAPIMIPVFYRLCVKQCKSQDLFKSSSRAGKTIFNEGFFDVERQAKISTQEAVEAIQEVALITGIENTERACNDEDCRMWKDRNRMRRRRLVERVAGAVMEALERRKKGNASR